MAARSPAEESSSVPRRARVVKTSASHDPIKGPTAGASLSETCDGCAARREAI